MFLKYISTTPLTNNDANAFFDKKIFGDDIYGDTTFIASMRAMLADRIPEGESVRFCYGSSSYSEADIEGISPKSGIRMLKANADHCIKLHSLDGNKDANDAWFKFAKENFTKEYSDWVEVPRVEAFFKKVIDVVCFVNVDLKSTTLIAKNIDRRRLHYIQCGIPVFFPWYFTEVDKVTEDDLELVKSLQMKTEKKYLEVLRKIASKYDFTSAKIKRLLSGFETRFEQDKLQTYKSRLESTMFEIRNLMENINNKLIEKTGFEDMILGLETKIENSEGSCDSEVMQYFLSNKALYLESVDGNRVSFAVKTHIEFYDEDLVEKMVKNHRSYIYSYVEPDMYDDAEKLVRAIFMDENLKIKTCAAFRVTAGGGVSPDTGHYFDESVFYDCIPNTHINRYGCMGNHTIVVNELLMKYDYVSAIDQCISSAKSLNFADSTVTKEFFRTLFGHGDSSINIKCIELPNGEVVDYKGAISWLNRADKEE